MSTPPSAVRYEQATPSTPRSTRIREIQIRLEIQRTTTISISHVVSFLVSLVLFQHTATDTQEAIALFRQDWICGAFTTANLRHSQFPDNPSPASSTATLSTPSTAATASPRTSPRFRTLLPSTPIERGVLAEETIKRHLLATRSLLRFPAPPNPLLTTNGSKKSPLRSALLRAIRHAKRFKRPIYLECPAIDPPNLTDRYLENQWAKPGMRWSRFKPDLVKFTARTTKEGKEEVVWEVVEIKFTQRKEKRLYNSYATQAIFYHIALLTLITPLIPTKTLVPSHKVSLWISTDPFSPVYSEESFSLRTHLAHVEHQLFVLLPRWLELVTVEEANRLEASVLAPRSVNIVDTSQIKPNTPARTFLDRLKASKPEPSPHVPLPQRLGSPLKKRIVIDLSPFPPRSPARMVFIDLSDSPSPSPPVARTPIIIDLTDSPVSPDVFLDAPEASASPTPAIVVKKEEIEESVTESKDVESLQLGIESLSLAPATDEGDGEGGCVVA